MIKEITIRLATFTLGIVMTGGAVSAYASDDTKAELSNVKTEQLQLIEKPPTFFNTLPNSMKVPTSNNKVPDELKPPKF